MQKGRGSQPSKGGPQPKVSVVKVKVPAQKQQSVKGSNIMGGKGGKVIAKPGKNDGKIKVAGRGGGLGNARPLQAFQNTPQRTNHGPKPALPAKWAPSPQELEEKKKRWAKFASFMAKPTTYPSSAYTKDLQGLDQKGAINLKKLSRDQWPQSIETKHFAFIAFCPYEGLDGELSIAQNGINVVDDAVLVAQTYLQRGYRVVYLQDPTPNEFTVWFDFLLEEVAEDLVVYFSGYGKKVIDYSVDDDKGEVQTCLLLYNKERKKGSKYPAPDATTGTTDDSVSEEILFNNIARLDYPEKKVLIYLDLYKSASIWEDDDPDEAALIAKLDAISVTPTSKPPAAAAKYPDRIVPPQNTIVIESLLDVDAVQKEAAAAAAKSNKKPAPSKGRNPKAGKGGASSSSSSKDDDDDDLSSGMAASIASQPQDKEFFSSLTSFATSLLNSVVSTYTTVTTSVPPATNPSTPTQPVIPPAQQETSITQVNQTKITPPAVIPPPEPSPVEIAGAETRWKQFAAEMKKPAAYTSKYKSLLTQLDSLGAINLDRVSREQIPDIRIDYVCALFFCPYESLPHTLDDGPINDAVTMTNLFLSRGYRVVYLCDGTPKEYYTWMDWLLDNVYLEVVTYFSGHGTQIPDYSGTEDDGLSEVLVFYDESKKKDNQGKKIKAQTGITENTISDTLMHDLIVSKQYPDTRVLCISDCCHSGTMFDFDSPVDPKLTYNKPPLNVVCIGAAKDEQTAKQTVLAGKESGIFTYNFSEYLKKNKNTTFVELETYMKKQIAKYQDIQITTSDAALLKKPIIVDGK